MTRGILQGIGLFRWIAWLMLAATAFALKGLLLRPGLSIGLNGITLIICIATTQLQRINPSRLLALPIIWFELAVGFGISFADGFAFKQGHAFSTAQSLGGVWPLAGVMTASLAWGPVGGILSGLAMGIARALADFVNGISITHLHLYEIISILTTIALFMLAGGIVGYISELLERAEKAISLARARDEVARTLHDGVLQTLAIVERKSESPQLVQLAREQRRELREYLFGFSDLSEEPFNLKLRPKRGGQRNSLATQFRILSAKFERDFDCRINVIVAEDLFILNEEAATALLNASKEVLANANLHGHASVITMYVEPEGEANVFCSIKDDGVGWRIQPVSATSSRNFSNGFI